MKIASFSIDVDPLGCYYDIHAIKSSQDFDDPIYEFALKRFLNLLEEENIKATFFITSRGLNDSAKKIIKLIDEKNHEIASHSFSHDYRLSLKSVDEILEDLQKNSDFLEEITNKRPVGFRAPGYNVTANLLKALRKSEFVYDSSLLPSPFYYFAKKMILILKQLSGNPSKSIITSLKQAFGGWKPYFPQDEIFKKGEKNSIVELPMTSVFQPIGLPIIGTSLIAFPEFLIDFMMKNSIKRDFVNVEMHGIDLSDKNDSILFDKISDKQPDLKYDLERKTKRIKKLIRFYKQQGFEFQTLRDYAKNY